MRYKPTIRTPRRRGYACSLCAVVIVVLIGASARAQDDEPEAPPPEQRPDHKTVQLTFPDNVELKTVLDYVATRLETNIIYGEEVASQRVTIRSPRAVPPERLLPLLRSTLRFRGFILTESDRGDWLTVRRAEQLTRQSEWMEQGQSESRTGNRVVTTLVMLEHMPTNAFRELVEPFLTRPGGNLVALPGGEGFVVTDYSRVVRTLERLREHADRPGVAQGWKVHRLQNASATSVNQTLQSLIQAKPDASSGDGDDSDGNQAQAVPIAEIDAFLLTGTPEQIRETEALLELLDVARPVRTRIYKLEHTTAGRAGELLAQIARPLQQQHGGEPWTISPDPEGNALVVTCPEPAHARIRNWLETMIDRPSTASPTGIRTQVFAVEYARAPELAETLQGVFAGGATAESFQFDPREDTPGRRSADSERGGGEQSPPDRAADAAADEAGAGGKQPSRGSRTTDPPEADRSGYDTRGINRPGEPGREPADPARRLFENRTGEDGESPVKLTVDEATNSIIATGPASYLAQVERLIDRLDHHRPQVLIEATIVSMSSSDGLDLGVDIQYLNAEDNELESGLLSNFGLLDVDPVTGATNAMLGSGLTAVLLRSDEVSVILRALQTRLDARIVANPRLLVADNETGTLDSIDEQPFTSINAGETVATTSFGGYAEAGTQLTLTPNISESDVVHLEYDIRSSSFTGNPSDPNLPPPRALDSVSSRVTIPSGYTLLVGGLTRKNHQTTRDQVPILGDLPLLGAAFRSQNSSDSETILYVFLRPVIHREDRFAYLRYQSVRALRQAEVDGDAPELKMEYLK